MVFGGGEGGREDVYCEKQLILENKKKSASERKRGSECICVVAGRRPFRDARLRGRRLRDSGKSQIGCVVGKCREMQK